MEEAHSLVEKTDLAKMVHEAIIDLYLQVKIRSNDEVSDLLSIFEMVSLHAYIAGD